MNWIKAFFSRVKVKEPFTKWRLRAIPLPFIKIKISSKDGDLFTTTGRFYGSIPVDAESVKGARYTLDEHSLHSRQRPSRAPIIKIKYLTRWNLKLNFTTPAFYSVNTRRDFTSSIDSITPNISVQFDRPAMSTVVVGHNEIGFSIFRTLNSTTERTIS